MATGWLLGTCMEARGKQDLWIKQKPEVLFVLREQAIIQSVESSNRIEGVTIPRERLRPIVLKHAKPRDRSEEEIAGYRKAMDWIFSRKIPRVIEPSTILHLHGLAQGGSVGDAGQWKRKDNEIIEILPNGERRVRFVPTSAKETPRVIEQLCKNYQEAREDERTPALLVIASFIFDFLCVHPFRDGNGRVSRLLTTFLLIEEGFEVGRYISLERLVEERKEEYYQILEKCSLGWGKGKNQILPWWNFFLSVVKSAYQEFGQKVESVDNRPAKSDLVRQVVLSQEGSFTLADLKAQIPVASTQLIKKVLSQMKQENKLKLESRGRGAYWKVTRN
jgi:Fic family protein